MNTEHPITPPPELLEQWQYDYYKAKIKHEELIPYVATQAARWGADMELEACCEWANATGWEGAGDLLRTARRPKPPSLKEQALTQLDSLHADLKTHGLGTNTDTICRALEALPDV